MGNVKKLVHYLIPILLLPFLGSLAHWLLTLLCTRSLGAFYMAADSLTQSLYSAAGMALYAAALAGVMLPAVRMEEGKADAAKQARRGALIVFCFSLRAPHDCGGLNLFNPIYLVFIALISILTSVSLSLFFGVHQSAQAEGFLVFVRDVSRAFADKQLILMLLVPAVLELIFRGVIFSCLEKTHFSVAMVLSTVAYAVAAYIMVFTHAKWSQGNTEAASCAFFIAFFIGAVHGVLTWRLRSVMRRFSMTS